MTHPEFHTLDGTVVPSVSADEMREIDRIAVEQFELGILQMMENAGRNLVRVIHQHLETQGRVVTVLAGSGGNGGGGICAARHLRIHGFDVGLALSRSPGDLGKAASKQLHVLSQSGVNPIADEQLAERLEISDVVIDALIGYGLSGKPNHRVAALIRLANQHAKTILSLDVPSGVEATTGERPGVAIEPSVTMTLALPKSGLHSINGDLLLADIGIPNEVYHAIGLDVPMIFQGDYVVRMRRT